MTLRSIAVTLLLASVCARPLSAQQSDSVRIALPASCRSCDPSWFADQRPVRIFGNTYYVGTHGLSVILVTSPRGDVLIDGGIAETAPLIMAHIRALGFHLHDVKLILNSHAHYDHAGGIAELAKASGASVAATAPSAAWLERGASLPDDPQYGLGRAMTPVPHVRVIRDGEVLHIGNLALTAHLTAGHTPGGTSWSWQSCEMNRCADIVYADSQTPISADGFFYTTSRTYPTGIVDFEHGFETLEHLRCDILITPHPGASRFWERIAARDSGDANALIDSTACRRLVAGERAAVEQRLAKERAAR